MSKNIQSVRGMHDVLPADVKPWQQLEHSLRSLMHAYGYQEIRLPLLEKTELFARSIGDVTDIVEKEMYTFEDRSGESLSLRPEGTASCVRAGIQHGLLHNQIQKLWYMGTMYRHERPQKGRYREFSQLGVEAFGLGGPDIDAELIIMGARLWRELGLNNICLELNSLGTHQERATYREALTEYFKSRFNELDADSRARLDRNPLRILDSKNPEMQPLIGIAPVLSDYLGAESSSHFQGLLERLNKAGIDYQLNPRLVRGLDYYNLTVFEWTTNELGAQGTVCAGGRYDGLVAQLGGSATPAIGFAMGLERLLALLQKNTEPQPAGSPDVYIITIGEAAEAGGLSFAESVRNILPGRSIVYHCGPGGLKNRLKRADRSGAELALIIGDDELAKQTVLAKPLRNTTDSQLEVAEAALEDYLKTYFINR